MILKNIAPLPAAIDPGRGGMEDAFAADY